MADNGTYQGVNITSYYDQAAILSPRTLVDVMKSMIPRIAMINRVIHRNFRAEPQFLLTGLRTGSMLQSMQTYIVRIDSMTSGEGGYLAEGSTFAKQTILTCPAIDDQKIYSVYKAPNDNLSRTVIIDFIYKPLFIIEEITNSMKRTFVKSRTAMELCRPEAIGCLYVDGLNDILGPDYRLAPNVSKGVL